MAQLFNSKVSIITKTEIRYEGHIYQINPQQQTIALKDVRSFGTEGRRPEHEIPPNQQSYDIIVFKAAEIKELKTFDENKPEENKLETKSEPNQKPPTSVPQQPENNQRQGTNPRAFDFDEMLEKANEIEKIKKQEVKPKYNPTSFFDSLSTSTQKQDRQPQQRNQNQIDTDTFGNFYKQRQYNNNGQRRNNNGTYNNNNNYHNRRQQQRVVYVEKQTQQPSQEQQQQ